MIERLLSQQSNVDWIELSRREKLQKRLLRSLSKKEHHVPPAFYNPNRSNMLQNSSRKSSLSASSARGRETGFSSPNFRSTVVMPKLNLDKRISRLGAQSSMKSSRSSSRDKRLLAERNITRGKFVTQLPEKALRSTF